MPLNQSSIFPPSRELNVNYNWADIASATGFTLYYGAGCNESTGTSYVLTPYTNITLLRTAAQENENITAGSASTSTSFVKVLDLDFDLSEAQIQQIVRGEGIVLVNWQNVTGAGSTGVTLYHSYAIAKLRKWDGASETEIASVQTGTFQDTENVTVDCGACVPITVPRTLIKKGENIRLTIELWGKGPGFSFTLSLKHDPEDASDNSRLGIAIPYKIEV